MKILIYSANFAPEPTGIGKYSGEMAAWLVTQGHEVRVVTAPPHYPNWQVAREFRWPPYQRNQWQGVSVWRAPLWVPRTPGGLTRILYLLSFALTSLPLALLQVWWRPDVVLTVAPAFLCAPAGWLTARLSGAKAWLHLQDFEIDIAFTMGVVKNPLLRRVISRLESLMLKRFDRVSTISQRMVEKLQAKGVRRDRTWLFPNWVDTRHISPFDSDGKPRAASRYRHELGIPEEATVLLFSGTLGAKQGLLAIPTVARQLAHRSDICFLICGEGVMKPQLLAATADLPNFRVLPLQPSEHLGELLCTADIHLLPQSACAEDLVLPSKLSGMTASGRPVIATCRAGTELHQVVSQCGLVVTPDDVEALTTAVLQLADNPTLRVAMGRCGRAWAEANLEREAVLQRAFGNSGAAAPMLATKGAAVSGAP
ncbi:MAG: glycosyltransferase WbuB [Steroidobacteraceae bacterium]